jgi:hypothetical protein
MRHLASRGSLSRDLTFLRMGSVHNLPLAIAMALALGMANRQKVVKHGNWIGCSPQSTPWQKVPAYVHEGAAIGAVVYHKDD